MDYIYKNYKWICGIALVLHVFYCFFLLIMFHRASGWNAMGPFTLLWLRQIPILFVQSLLFVWAAFLKEKHKVQIMVNLVLTVILILASVGVVTFDHWLIGRWPFNA